MKKTLLFLFCVILPGALVASRVINMTMEETIRRSPLIVVGTVTGVKTRTNKCETTTLVAFDIRETLKGSTAMKSANYSHSVYSFERDCDQVSFMTYPSGKTFTRKDIGKDAIFFFCFSPDSSHCCDDTGARHRVLAILKKARKTNR